MPLHFLHLCCDFLLSLEGQRIQLRATALCLSLQGGRRGLLHVCKCVRPSLSAASCGSFGLPSLSEASFCIKAASLQVLDKTGTTLVAKAAILRLATAASRLALLSSLRAAAASCLSRCFCCFFSAAKRFFLLLSVQVANLLFTFRLCQQVQDQRFRCNDGAIYCISRLCRLDLTIWQGFRFAFLDTFFGLQNAFVDGLFDLFVPHRILDQQEGPAA